jgi:hypothetical protein
MCVMFDSSSEQCPPGVPESALKVKLFCFKYVPEPEQQTGIRNWRNWSDLDILCLTLVASNFSQSLVDQAML